MKTVAVAHPAQTSARLGVHIRITANETAKGLRLLWRRRGLLVTATIVYGLTYLGFSLAIGGGHIVKPLAALTLPALAAAVVAATAALQGSGGIAEEINGGTLEQTQLSPARPEVQALGRLTALAIEGVLAAVALAVAFTLILGLRYQPSPAVMIPAVLTVADGLGYGLLILALTVRVASIGAITHVFNMMVMFFGGVLFPVAILPSALETFTRFLPITLGVQALNVTLAGRPLSVTWSDGTLPWLLVHAAVSLSLGCAVYGAAIRRARRQGGLR
ncbi:MAG: ABC transporter permease [Candidatus Dormibacteria bacterium]